MDWSVKGKEVPHIPLDSRRSLHFTYLGVPVFIDKPSKLHLLCFSDKVIARL